MKITTFKNDKNGLLRMKIFKDIDCSKLVIKRSNRGRNKYVLLYEGYIVKDKSSLYDIVREISNIRKESNKI